MDVKDVARPGIEPWCRELASCAISARRIHGVEWRDYFQTCGFANNKLVDLQIIFYRRNDVQLHSLQNVTTISHFTLLRTQQAPNYLHKHLPAPLSCSGYAFRKISYPVPADDKSLTLKGFFSLPRAIILWNALAAESQSMKSVYRFKAALRNNLNLNNRVLRLPAIVLLKTTFQPGINETRAFFGYLIVTIICEYKILRFWDSDDIAGTKFCDFTKSS